MNKGESLIVAPMCATRTVVRLGGTSRLLAIATGAVVGEAVGGEDASPAVEPLTGGIGAQAKPRSNMPSPASCHARWHPRTPQPPRKVHSQRVMVGPLLLGWLRATDAVDQTSGVVGHGGSSPGHMSVGPDQHQRLLVQLQ